MLLKHVFYKTLNIYMFYIRKSRVKHNINTIYRLNTCALFMLNICALFYMLNMIMLNVGVRQGQNQVIFLRTSYM